MKVTNEMIYDLMKGHIDKDEANFKAIQESLDGCDEYPGVRGRLHALETTLKFQKRISWGVGGTLGLYLIAWLKEKLGL